MFERRDNKVNINVNYNVPQNNIHRQNSSTTPNTFSLYSTYHEKSWTKVCIVF